MSRATKPLLQALNPASSLLRRIPTRSLAPLALVPLLVFACGGGEAVLPPPGVTEFANSLAHALCDNLAGCCKTNGFSFDAGACLAQTQTAAQTYMIGPGVADGARYNPTAASACLALYTSRAQACDDALLSGIPTDLPGGGESCPNLFVGVVAPGQPCTSTFDCAPGPSGSTVVCEALGVSAVPTCTVTGTMGARCTVGNCYPSGLTCVYSACAERSSVGGECVSDSDCVPSAYCPQSGKCAARDLPTGAPCESSPNACGVGSYCNGATSSATCTPDLGYGAPCTQNAACGACNDVACGGACIDLQGATRCSSSELVQLCGP